MKRAESIVRKLGRENHTRLETMRDLGGCRVVLPRVADVRQLEAHLLSSAANIDIRSPPKDLMVAPDVTGYRALHFTAHGKNGRRVEIQLRSELQHSWASLVETFDRSYGCDFKHGSGPEALGGYLKVLSVAHFELEINGQLPAIVNADLEAARRVALEFITRIGNPA